MAVHALRTGADDLTLLSLEDPSREIFEREIAPACRPVLLKNSMPTCEARGWTPERLADLCGDAEYPVEVHKSVRGKDWDYRPMTVRQFIEAADRNLFLVITPLDKKAPALRANLQPPRVVPARTTEQILFAGWDTFSELHYHVATRATLSQVVGTKVVRLYPPEETRNLYPVGIWKKQGYCFSRVYSERPDQARFPRFSKARHVDCTLHPGDTLYIPNQWWHSVLGSGFCVSFTNFWKAPWSDWYFPVPGVRDLVNQSFYWFYPPRGWKF